MLKYISIEFYERKKKANKILKLSRKEYLDIVQVCKILKMKLKLKIKIQLEFVNVGFFVVLSAPVDTYCFFFKSLYWKH